MKERARRKVLRRESKRVGRRDGERQGEIARGDTDRHIDGHTMM